MHFCRLRFSDGEVGRLWTSAVALGQAHGLTLRVFGERGGLRWGQEHPNQLYWTPLGKSTRTLERGDPRLAEAATRGSRAAVGHAEGLLSAFGNIYSDLAEALRARAEGRTPNASALSYPSGEDGLHTLAVVHAAAASAQNGGKLGRSVGAGQALEGLRAGCYPTPDHARKLLLRESPGFHRRRFGRGARLLLNRPHGAEAAEHPIRVLGRPVVPSCEHPWRSGSQNSCFRPRCPRRRALYAFLHSVPLMHAVSYERHQRTADVADGVGRRALRDDRPALSDLHSLAR